MNVETPTLPSPSMSAPRICQPRRHRAAGLSCTPFPSSPCSPKVSKRLFLLLTSVRRELEPVHIEGMKGMLRDDVLAVRLVLMGEIPTHSDTSLLTPPICILMPLGNSGGQIKQVCFGLGKNQTNISVYLSGSGIMH